MSKKILTMEECPIKKKQIIALIACMIVGIAGFTGVYLSEQSNKEQQENNQVAMEESEQGQEISQQVAQAQNDSQTEVESGQSAENEGEVASSQVASVIGDGKSTEENLSSLQDGEEEKVVATSNETTLHFTPENGLTWPLEGNVLLNYSMDSTVYFETLDQYRYNPAMIIGGDINSKVKLIAKGKIKDISTNEETGCTVVQDLGDGYEAVYGQLKEVNFEVGDLVEEGQVIGYVSEPTKYYSKEGSNLYFALRKDGEPVDPLEYFE